MSCFQYGARVFDRFMRELSRLKTQADYQSCDPTKMSEWLTELGEDFSQYAYQMLKGGADRRILRFLSDSHLRDDCRISNGIRIMKILDASKSMLINLHTLIVCRWCV